jgi:hypothetical protein
MFRLRLCLWRLGDAGERLVQVLHQRGIPAREILWGSELAHVCERLERRSITTGELDDPGQRHACDRARAGRRWGLPRGHASTKLVAQLPPSGLVIVRHTTLLEPGIAAPSDPRQRFDRGEHIVSVDVVVRSRARVVEQRPQALEPLDLVIDTRPVGSQRIGERSTIVREDPTDVREREAELTQRTDPLETSHVVLVVDALLSIGPRSGREQADALVVVERADGQTGRARQLADAPAAAARRSFLHRQRRYNLTSRQLQATFGSMAQCTWLELAVSSRSRC